MAETGWNQPMKKIIKLKSNLVFDLRWVQFLIDKIKHDFSGT
jgi:hypothetical protein